jgi:hypothetical protein
MGSWFIDYTHNHCFIILMRMLHSNGDVTFGAEGPQNLDLCSVLMDFEQGRIFIMPHLLWHRASGFLVPSEGPPHLVDKQRIPGPSLTQILTEQIGDNHGNVKLGWGQSQTTFCKKSSDLQDIGLDTGTWYQYCTKDLFQNYL